MANKKILKRIFLISTTSILIILTGIIIQESFKIVFQFKGNISKKHSAADYHFILTGTDYVDDIFSGAKEKADELNVILDKVPMDKAFEYAYFVDADGIIIFNDKDDFSIPSIVDSASSKIPVVLIGKIGIPDDPVSYISTGGIAIAEEFSAEITKHKEWKDILFISKKSNQNFSSSIFSMIHKICSHDRKLKMEILPDDRSLNFEDYIKSLIIEKTPDCIISFNPDTTLTVTRSIINLDMVGKIGIAGYNSNSLLDSYCDKKVISLLVSSDFHQAGIDAVQQLYFEKQKKFVNAYISTGLTVRKSR